MMMFGPIVILVVCKLGVAKPCFNQPEDVVAGISLAAAPATLKLCKEKLVPQFEGFYPGMRAFCSQKPSGW